MGRSQHFAAARCSVSDGSRNPLVTLGLSDRSRCGALLIFMVKEILCRDLGKEVSYRELAQRSCTESFFRGLLQRSYQEISCRDLAKELS